MEEEPTFQACRKCFGEVARGISHHCTEANGVKNVTAQALALGDNFQSTGKGYQRVATKLLATQMEQENISRGESFSAATGRKIVNYIDEYTFIKQAHGQEQGRSRA